MAGNIFHYSSLVSSTLDLFTEMHRWPSWRRLAHWHYPAGLPHSPARHHACSLPPGRVRVATVAIFSRWLHSSMCPRLGSSGILMWTAASSDHDRSRTSTVVACYGVGARRNLLPGYKVGRVALRGSRSPHTHLTRSVARSATLCCYLLTPHTSPALSYFRNLFIHLLSHRYV